MKEVYVLPLDVAYWEVYNTDGNDVLISNQAKPQATAIEGSYKTIPAATRVPIFWMPEDGKVFARKTSDLTTPVLEISYITKDQVLAVFGKALASLGQ